MARLEMRLLAGAALVAASGLAAAWFTFPGTVEVDAGGDWRAISQGLRRSGDPRTLTAPPDAIVHVHDVRGGLRAVTLHLSARHPGPVTLVVDERRRIEAALETAPRAVAVALEGSATDIDVRLGAPDRTSVHAITIERGDAGGPLRIVPLVCGLVVFATLLRAGAAAPGAAAGGVAAVLIGAWSLATAVDPLALLPLRPGTRAAVQAGALALIAAAGIAQAHRRGVAAMALAAAVAVLYAPTAGYGLVYDDFLWTRPWTLAELASTFHGSEDPTGVSNSYYRPLASTSHALDYALWGFRPALYHGTNLALIAAAGLAAFSLLRRLDLVPAAALAGALVWVVHPMSASAVAWMSQRTDTILALLYLLTLRALFARPFPSSRVLVVAGLGVLTFGAKELAVTLPVAAALFLWSFPSDEDRPRRWRAVRGLALIVLAYVPLWIAMFPEKLVTRTGASSGWGGFDPGGIGDWLRLLPALYGPIVLPTGYAAWWHTRLQEWSVPYLCGVVVATAGIVSFLCADPERRWRRLGIVAAVWPLVVIAPLLGLRGIDLYRGGLLVALAAGWMAAVVAQRLHARHALLPAAGMAVLVLFATPLTRESAAAWGPGGFYRSMTQRSNRQMESWLASLQPHCRAHFWKQVARDEHMAGGR